MTGAAVFILRRKRPDLSRPYRVLFYPVLPAVFVLSATALVVATLIGSPRESLFGIAIIALGLPFYWYWERKKRQPPVQNPAKG
jgi:APA family basic amino acid/polyamine antiporter